MEKIKISLYDLLKCISNAQDLISPRLSNHQKQVAYLSYILACEMKLSIIDQRDIFLAALVHDIGALSKSERLEIIEAEPMTIHNHAFIGAKLLDGFKPMKRSVRIIRYHHMNWDEERGTRFQGNEVPYGSHIIHLADRVCLMIRPEENILSQIPQIIERISEKSGSVYDPKLVDILKSICRDEYIWLNIISSSPISKVNTSLFEISELEIDDIIDLSFIFSQIIDFRSSFTARHSAGVARISERLASLIGFSPVECKMMLVAGYLHDIGKLAIDNAVLEKPTKLDEEEFNEIRSHTYYTYQLLDMIPQFKIINEWASYHHERLDGRGYPFHIKGDNLSYGSRIMAVADVFTAITENRPYRLGMSDVHAVKVLENMVESGALDKNVVNVLKDNFQMINELREFSQEEAASRYERFLSIELE